MQPVDDAAEVVEPTLGQVVRDAARADERVVHAQTGERFEEIEDHLALTEPDGHDRRRANLHAAGADGHEVRCDAAQLHHEHANHLSALRDVVGDVEELLHRHAVHGFVEQRGDVVHARHVRDGLGPRLELGVLLDTCVEEADAGADGGDRFTLHLQHQAQHAVGGRVRGAHVDDDGLVAALGLFCDDLFPVATLGEVGVIGWLLAGGRVNVLAHE